MITRRSLFAGAVLQTRKTPVIDAHCHAGAGTALKDPWNTEASVGVTLRHMREAGIDRTIVFPINNRTYEEANREIARICERYPDKFIGFAKHDPETEGGRIAAMLKHEVKSLGLKGLKLHRHPTREVMDALVEFRLPLLYHPERMTFVNTLAEAYPKVPIIVAHLGSFGSQQWSEHLAAIDAARRYPNVYLETSSVVFFKYLEQAAREAGPDKLIFGSDGPELDSRVELYKIKLLKLPPADEAKVLGGNIARLL